MSMVADPHAYVLQDSGIFPGSRLPALVYERAVPLPARDPAAAFEALFARHGWTGSWRNGIYTFHHYHSVAHEVLGIFTGQVSVQLGGDKGVTITAKAGDVLVIPAGVAHKNLGATDDFRCVGAYPEGTSPDMKYGKPGERPAADRAIAQVPLPRTDPVGGAAGPLVALWNKARRS